MVKIKKLNTAVNKEIDQAISAINFTEFTQIDRPKPGRSRIKIFCLVFLFGLLSAWYAYHRQEGRGLTDYLPADALFYASLSLPQDKEWFTPLFFWRRGDKPNAAVGSLYPRLDLISWPGASWSEKILPLLSGQIELARLSNNKVDDPTAGGLIMRVGLKDRLAWFRLFGAAGGYAGEVRTTEVARSGAWVTLTKNPNKIVWRILGNDLYIADNESILRDLSNKKPNSLRSVLKSMKVKSGLATFYLGNNDILDPNNPYLRALGSSLVLPAAMVVRQADQTLNFTVTSANQGENREIARSALAGKLLAYDTAFYAQAARAAYQNRLLDNLTPILKDFYNLDIDSLLTEIGGSEIFIAGSGNDWLLNTANKNNQSNDNLLARLKKAAAARFAVIHPRAVEQKLSDGSTMIELRAEAEGLEWLSEPWSYAGISVDLAVLRGAGEANGYFVGFVPEIGLILTTSMSMLNQYTQIRPLPTDCDSPQRVVMGASWPIKRLIFDKIIITASPDNKMTGCVLLTD